VYVLTSLYTHLVECAAEGNKQSAAETGVVVLKVLN